MLTQDLGTLPYRDAWILQEHAHADVLAGGQERILFLQHPPVITFGRRGPTQHLLASPSQLTHLGIDLVESDRGGDVTFHGPGQLVAYPILRLADHRLTPSSYVHTLEKILIQTLADLNVPAHTDSTAVGVWVNPTSIPQSAIRNPQSSKIAAIGVRIRRGVSLHGLALNISTNLNSFNLITPCGLTGRSATSLQQILGPQCPPLHRVQSLLAHHALAAFSSSLNPPITS